MNCWFCLILCLATIYEQYGWASGNPFRHGHNTPSNQRRGYISIVPMDDASSFAGTGSYRVQRTDIFQIIDLENIDTVEVQFRDYGEQSGRDEFLNDIFVVRRVSENRSETVLSEFNIPSYSFYRKGRRSADITENCMRWLRNLSEDDYFMLKFSKIGDTNNRRFANNPEEQPSIVLASSTLPKPREPPITTTVSSDRSLRQRRSPNTQPCPNNSPDGVECCLLTLPLSGNKTTISFLILEEDHIVGCAGGCYDNPEDMVFKRIFNSKSTNCCKNHGPLTEVPIRYSTANNTVRSNMLLNASACQCT
ncbi:uncharacterized protein [Watersipora subatra]|uniref:uncharacterized protein n=1 Tax=Watersipora subatra TaxID=2589382 RepID=UPI00355BC08E